MPVNFEVISAYLSLGFVPRDIFCSYRLGRNLSLVVQLVQHQSHPEVSNYNSLKKRQLCSFQFLLDGLISGFYVDYVENILAISVSIDLALQESELLYIKVK